MALIFINPGHSKDGQPDCGCVYNGLKEYEVASRIASQLEKCLAFNGFATKLYQQTGYGNVSSKQLNSIATSANQVKADLFISIHMNGVLNESAKGTETIYSNRLVRNKLLADHVNNELIKPFDDYQFNNRGAKLDSRGLAVLKHTNMPAVLTEIGFISNPNEAKFIDTHINEIAQRLCNAICRYFNVEAKVYQEISTSISYPNEILLSHTGDGKYNVKINSGLKLANNKLSTCLDWIKKSYV